MGIGEDVGEYDSLGDDDARTVGAMLIVGGGVGSPVGPADGADDGTEDGLSWYALGRPVGEMVGPFVGPFVGSPDGDTVGETVMSSHAVPSHSQCAAFAQSFSFLISGHTAKVGDPEGGSVGAAAHPSFPSHEQYGEFLHSSLSS